METAKIASLDGPPLVITNKNGKVIFQVNWDGTVIGAVEDAGEAARKFAETAALILAPYRKVA